MCLSIPSFVFIVSLFLPSCGPSYHVVLHYGIIIDVVQSLRALEPQAIEPQARTIMIDCLSEDIVGFHT